MAQYGDRINAGPSSESDAGAPYKVIFVRDTKATTCYGCKGRVRHKASDPPPPPPHDIFLHHMERRVYKRRGETKIHITTTPELVFYHPLRSCAPTASRDSIHIDEAIQCKLAESNKQLLSRIWHSVLKTFSLLTVALFDICIRFGRTIILHGNRPYADSISINLFSSNKQTNS